MGKIRTYEELTISDDFMFCKVMIKHPELCKELLELIIGQKIRRIDILNEQKPIEITMGGKGIRLDVYIEDDLDTVYDVEMQTVFKKDLPKRTRYYQGMIDLNMISRGSEFKELKKSYIIFICTFDSFGHGRHKYTFENTCNEIPELKLGDESVKIFLNAEGTVDDVTEDMHGFLKLLVGQLTENKLAKRLADAVDNIKLHNEWRDEYMLLLQRDAEKRAEGREEGRTELIIELVRDKAISAAEGARRLFLTDDEFVEIMKAYEKKKA